MARRSQTGAALLIATLVLLLTAGHLSWRALSTNRQLQQQQQQRQQLLARAKQALIGYATHYVDNYNGGAGPGHLPCPDTEHAGPDDNGSPDSSCKAHEIGRLPTTWLRDDTALALYPFSRSQARRFWYVPAEDFRYCCSQRVNGFTAGSLRVDDTTDVVAVLIDPGPPLQGQVRPSDNPADYLEQENADGDTDFVSHASGLFNDHLIYITRDEIMQPVIERVLWHARDLLIEHLATANTLPHAAPLGAGAPYNCTPDLLAGHLPIDAPCDDEQALNLPSWFTDNGWHEGLFYRIADDCSPDCQSPPDKLHATTAGIEHTGLDGLLVFFGAPLVRTDGHVQDRTRQPQQLSDYLDAPQSDDASFSFPRRDAQHNDRFIGIRLTQ